MVKFLNIQSVVLKYCTSSFRIIVRTQKNDEKSPVIKKRVEDKKFFGPLLENSEKRKKILKLKKNQITPTDTINEIDNNSVKNNNHNENNLSEIQWSAKTTSLKSIRIKNNDHSYHFVVSDISNKKLEPTTIKNEVNDDLKLDKKILNSRITEKTDSQISQETSKNLNIVNNSNSNNNNNVNDVSNTSITLEDKSNISIESNSNYCTKKFPLINTVKSDQDQWEESQRFSKVTIEGKNFSLPGVTKILNATMPDEARNVLEKWKEKMILNLGAEGFEKYMKDQQETSKLMHSLISNFLENKPIEIPDHLQSTFRSINIILKNVKNVRVVESHVIHSDLRYRGIVDCVADYGGNLCLIDWKKSDKIKTLNTTYDLPLQLSAYVGALNRDPNYPFKVKTAVLAVAYSNGQPPSLFEFSESKLKFYWKEWLKRVEKYYLIK